MFSAGLLFCIISLTAAQVINLTQEDKDKIVDLQNQAQSNYGVAPLVWSNDLQASAEGYAAGCNWGHSGAAGKGENLAIAMKDPAAAYPEKLQSFRDQISGWYEEYKYWSCATGSCSSECGHLTQMVSKRTTAVGCGVVRCPKGTPFSMASQYMVCQYTPQGNMNLASEHPCTGLPYPWNGCPSTNPALVDIKPPPPPTTPPPQPKPTPQPQTPAPKPGPLPSTVPTPKPAPKPGPQPSTVPTPTPKPAPGERIVCKADYWPNGKQVITDCLKAPVLFSVKDQNGLITKKPYCDCGAPDKYYWPVTNAKTCNYPSALMSESDSTSSTGLPLGAWIGIGVAAFALIVIIIAIVIIIKNKKPTDERV